MSSLAPPSAASGRQTNLRRPGFWQEVAVARIYDGVYYRFSTEVGSAMGRKICELAASKFPRATR
jgi:hypothetical protein